MSGTLIQDSLTRAREALADAAEGSLFTLPDDQLRALQEDAMAVVRMSEAVLVALVGEGASRGVGRKETGARSAKEVLVQRLRLSPRHAKDLLETAEALRDPAFEPVAQALADGVIGAEHARRITHAVNKLPDDATVETRGLAQAALLEDAGGYDPDKVARFGQRILGRVDPDAADRELAKQLEREEREAARERVLWFKDSHDGIVHFGGRLDAASARVVRTALEPLAKPTAGEADGSETGQNGARRSYGQRMADALVELARRSLQSGTIPKHGGEPTQLMLTMRLDDLMKGLGAAFLPTGETITAARARLLACDAGIIPAILNTHSIPLDVGRAKRCFEGKLRKALDLRDAGCAFPACDIPAAWCDAHHIKPWWTGGITSLDNGVLLCRHHHTTIHNSQWVVRPGVHGRPEFLPPPYLDPTQTPQRNHLHEIPHAA
ncbi:HNH endonuclease signature motif containing protein [Flindersiella endophytica]